MKYTAPRLRPDGWSEWIQPRMRLYRMACCDCGLVHDMRFRVVRGPRSHKVVFAAKRNERATAAKRRHRKETR